MFGCQVGFGGGGGAGEDSGEGDGWAGRTLS